ncbi:hypothetical protein GH714_042096 [Hevea brasiliensis]|uniref:Anaphase-promoting complex subunit 4 WD40 domain-containing protein n=1 Tax=Hevea brasiliensis TaxID=3981 RepID=A0A6A6MW24_HEVBR|nr:hypothetical protein GH714_042096 [Hevea brasiliensis]
MFSMFHKIQVLTVSADKTAKIWEISENGCGNVIKTLAFPASGGVDDMLVGCHWQNHHLVIVSLGGTIHLFSASDLDKAPVQRVPLNGDECGAAEQVDTGSQPKDLSLAIDSPGLVLVSTDSGVALLKGLKVVSNINLGFT